MDNVKFRTPYDGDETRHGDIDFGDEPSLAIQSAADECDINLIIDRAKRGIVPNSSSALPTFGDYSAIGDYQSALNAVIEAQSLFEALPAAIRDRFDNEPAKLLAFVASDQNRDEAIRLGIVAPPEPLQAARSEPQANDTLLGGLAPANAGA